MSVYLCCMNRSVLRSGRVQFRDLKHQGPGAGPLSISRIREAGLVDYSELGSLCPLSQAAAIHLSQGEGVQAQCDQIFQYFSPKLQIYMQFPDL